LTEDHISNKFSNIGPEEQTATEEAPLTSATKSVAQINGAMLARQQVELNKKISMITDPLLFSSAGLKT
jgi:hypothetical protein